MPQNLKFHRKDDNKTQYNLLVCAKYAIFWFSLEVLQKIFDFPVAKAAAL